MFDHFRILILELSCVLKPQVFPDAHRANKATDYGNRVCLGGLIDVNQILNLKVILTCCCTSPAGSSRP